MATISYTAENIDNIILRLDRLRAMYGQLKYKGFF